MGIKNYLDENDNGEVSPPILWDERKAVLRGVIINYCTDFKKQRKIKLHQLQTDLKNWRMYIKPNLEPEVFNLPRYTEWQAIHILIYCNMLES